MILLSERQKKKSHKKIETTLIPGECYKVMINSIAITQGKTSGTSIILYDKENNKVVKSTILDIDYYRSKGGYYWTFSVPSEGDKKI